MVVEHLVRHSEIVVSRPLALEAQPDGTLRLQLDLHSLWERPLGGPVAALAANEHFAAAIVTDADDGTSSCLVYALLPGVLALPRLVLPGAPAALCLSAGDSGVTHLMVVTVNAHVAVWDLVRRRSVLQVRGNDVYFVAIPTRLFVVGERV